MKKLVIFDLGDVCVRIYVERCNETWLRLAGRELMGDGVFDVEAGHRHERGEIAGAELWEALRGSLGLDLTDDQWKEGWNSIFGTEIEETRRTVTDMKAAGVRVVALSNTNKEHVEMFMSLYSEFAGMFDALYFSNEMGARKPERRIYETVLELEGVEGRETVFFDDKLENVEAALELGIEGVHFIHDSVAADWWEGKRGVEYHRR